MTHSTKSEDDDSIRALVYKLDAQLDTLEEAVKNSNRTDSSQGGKHTSSKWNSPETFRGRGRWQNKSRGRGRETNSNYGQCSDQTTPEMVKARGEGGSQIQLATVNKVNTKVNSVVVIINEVARTPTGHQRM